MNKIRVELTQETFNDAKSLMMPNMKLNALSYEEFLKHIPINEIDSLILLKFYAETNLVIRHTIMDRDGNGVHFDMFGAYPIDGCMLPYSGLYNSTNSISAVNRFCDISITEICDSIKSNEDFNGYIVEDDDKIKEIKIDKPDCNYKFL